MRVAAATHSDFAAGGEVSREAYSPQWAPHVKGVYERAMDDDGLPEPTWVLLACDKCRGTHRVHCTSGAPRQHVQAFARLHLHRDPMDHGAFLKAVKGGDE